MPPVGARPRLGATQPFGNESHKSIECGVGHCPLSYLAEIAGPGMAICLSAIVRQRLTAQFASAVAAVAHSVKEGLQAGG